MSRRALALAVAAVLASSCRGAANAPPEGARPGGSAPGEIVVPVESPMLQHIRREKVALAELPTEELTTPGKIEVNPNRVSRVVLPVGGRVSQVLVKTGDAVRKDQALVALESPDADAAWSMYRSAEASLAQSKVGLGKAQADLDRASDLFQHDAIAKKEVLIADNGLAQAKAGLEQAEAAREQAVRRLLVLGLRPQDRQQPVVVRSPLAGKVLELAVVPGEYRNDTNTPLMTIADLSTVWITSQVPESYIRFVQVGERVDITLVAYPGQTFEGRVSRIADTVDAQTRTIKVQAEMVNPAGRLRPEMYGSVHHIESTSPVPVLPVGAVLQAGSRSVIFVETGPGRFEQRTVTVGARSGDVVRVVSGVAAGESVVVDGAMLLQSMVPRG